ncbi:MAG TPA: hypothetical protein DEW31_02090 [Alistipes obesi]|nr:hypothetical protein [Alistipes communis]
MNKKLFFGMFAAATMLLATSCSNDELDGVQSGKESVVSFTLEQPGLATRAYSDGTTATTLTYAVYEAGTKTPLITSENKVTFTNKTATVNLRLVTGKSYDILFWADAENAPYTFNANAQTITVADNLTSQDENRDAFFAAEKSLVVDGAINKTITLYRPFAQLNIGTTDATESSTAAFNPTQSTVTVKNVYKTLNLFDGAVSNETEMTYAMANIPGAGETFPVADVKYLSMNYLLVASEKELVEVDFTVTDGTHSIDRKYASVPVQRNYRTNIYGKILTDPADFNITIAPEYETPNYEVVVWDGKTVTEPTSNDTEWIITTAAEWIYLKQNGVQGKNIKLAANIDFGGHEVKGLGFDGEFDGQGYTMSNMTLLCGGSYYSNGLFQGDASNDATIKNVTIENVTAECANPDQGYVGAIFGDVQTGKTVILNGVNVKNANLCGVQSVGGLVGFVASGATLNVNNCTVDGSEISNYAVDNESGYVAGLVGRPAGTVDVQNSTVTNTTIDAYYASRRGESSIQPVVGDNTNLTAGEDVKVSKTSLDGAIFVSTAEELCQINTLGKVSTLVFLTADIDFKGAAMSKNIELWGNDTFDGQGHKISNVVCKNQGANYAISLFRGDAIGGKKVIKNLVIDGIEAKGVTYFAAALWSDLQNQANIEIDNVHISGADIQSANSAGGFIGFVGAGTTDVVIKNSSINASSINSDNAARTGALVGRAHGCGVTLENVAVNGVKVNSAAATTSTLVKGENSYTGTVTVK